MTSSTEARKEIAAIDRLIDANRAAANDKALEADLFRQRGFAQLRRDEADRQASLAAARAKRIPKPRQCPTCHAHTLYVA